MSRAKAGVVSRRERSVKVMVAMVVASQDSYQLDDRVNNFEGLGEEARVCVVECPADAYHSIAQEDALFICMRYRWSP